MDTRSQQNEKKCLVTEIIYFIKAQRKQMVNLLAKNAEYKNFIEASGSAKVWRGILIP